MTPRLALEPMLFDLPEGETTVGSGAQANWRVQGRDLMARHFTIRVAGRTATVRSASNDAVVAMDGSQVVAEERALADGSVINAGSASFTYWADVPGSRTVMPPPPEPPAHLVDDASATAYPLHRTSTAIGRDPSNVVILQDPTASRFHAEIRREAGGYALHGMGSSGTKLNGAQLTAPRLLGEGDVVEIATARLRFTESGLPSGIRVAVEDATVDPGLAARGTVQRERVSLDNLKAMGEPPRSNLGLLAVAAVVVVLLVVVFFWVVRG